MEGSSDRLWVVGRGLVFADPRRFEVRVNKDFMDLAQRTWEE